MRLPLIALLVVAAPLVGQATQVDRYARKIRATADSAVFVFVSAKPTRLRSLKNGDGDSGSAILRDLRRHGPTFYRLAQDFEVVTPPDEFTAAHRPLAILIDALSVTYDGLLEVAIECASFTTRNCEGERRDALTKNLGDIATTYKYHRARLAKLVREAGGTLPDLPELWGNQFVDPARWPWR